MRPQDLQRLRRRARAGNPSQHVIHGAAGQRRRMEEAHQHLRRLGGVEACRVITCPVRGRADRAGSERLRPTLSSNPIHAPDQRIPHQLGQARRQIERVQHHARPAIPDSSRPRQQQIIRLRQRHQRCTRRPNQRRREHVQRLARPLRTDHACRPVPRTEHLPSPRHPRLPNPPADLPRVERHSQGSAPDRDSHGRLPRTGGRFRVEVRSDHMPCSPQPALPEKCTSLLRRSHSMNRRHSPAAPQDKPSQDRACSGDGQLHDTHPQPHRSRRRHHRAAGHAKSRPGVPRQYSRDADQQLSPCRPMPANPRNKVGHGTTNVHSPHDRHTSRPSHGQGDLPGPRIRIPQTITLQQAHPSARQTRTRTPIDGHPATARPTMAAVGGHDPRRRLPCNPPVEPPCRPQPVGEHGHSAQDSLVSVGARWLGRHRAGRAGAQHRLQKRRPLWKPSR